MLIALRNLLVERLRFIISLTGVTFAVVLVLVMSGIYLGTLQSVTTYIDHTDDRVWVAQPGVDQMFRAVSWLDKTVVDDVKTVPDVESASPILGVPSSFSHDGMLTAYYLVGCDPNDTVVGPWKLSEGRNVQQPGETVMDSVLAKKNGIHVGDEVTLINGEFTVVGLSEDTAAVGNFYVFITMEDAAEQLKAEGRMSYAVVTPRHGVSAERLRDEISAEIPDAEVLTSADFADNSRAIVKSMVGRPLMAMIVIGVFVGLALVTLTILSMTAEQMREFGILRAIGARPRQLYLTVIAQALILAVLGYISGVAITYGIQVFLAGRVGDVTIWIPPGLVATMAAGSAAMAIIGSIIPVRSVSGLDPAAAFRG